MDSNRALDLITTERIHNEIARRASAIPAVNCSSTEFDPHLEASRQVFEELLLLCVERMEERASAA